MVNETSVARSRRPLSVQDNPPSNADTKGKGKSKKRGRPKKDANEDAADVAHASASSQQDSRDVTVQGCLDGYIFAERLEDHNQFYCSNCARKCDAERSVSLSKLPPVLKTLLARYVFDRLTFIKKKLSDRILLPRTLMVPTKRTFRNGGKDVEEVEHAVYVLCSIQNHRGELAYGGHYVAEAMDWTTGVWYDYNDENVTLLPNGPPNCSYVPATQGDDGSFSATIASAAASAGAASGNGKVKRVAPL